MINKLKKATIFFSILLLTIITINVPSSNDNLIEPLCELPPSYIDQ